MELNIDTIFPEEGSVRNIKKGDYQQDGLWYCGKCHTKKQTRVSLGGKERIVPCLCHCEAEKMEEEKKEQERKQEMIRIEQLRQASLMPGKFRNITFRDYRKRPENERAFRIAIAYVKQFAQNEKNNYGLLFYGPVGTGKSFTAACIANALLEQDISVVMTSFVKILQEIGPGSGVDEGEYIRGLNRARLLIIDDLGAERSTDYAQEKVYNIIDSRVRANKPMILTTNLKMSEMLECTDIKFKRIYDRIFEACLPVEVNGTSFRMEHAAERQEAMRRFFNKEGNQ
jgi:DNA replication protein DnaC